MKTLDKSEHLLYAKYLYFKNGISAKQFRQESITDIEDILEIENAINERAARQRKIQEMRARMK